jgi:integrase/recombinase XerC
VSRRVGNCSTATIRIYTYHLARFRRTTGLTYLGDVSLLVIQQYLTWLRETLNPTSTHQHLRVLRTFLKWAVETGLLAEDPARGVSMKVPKTLPRVPEDDHVRRLLSACRDDFEGRRNRALVALLADSGLRISEALRLRIEDVNFSTRSINVRQGKGGQDGVGFFGAETAQIMRVWIGTRGDAMSEDFVFTNRQGRALSRTHAILILHRLSTRARLPWKISPHKLRHYCATAILKQTGDLELVRQVLRHETLTMALRYAHLTRPDISRKFRRASPLDNLRAGR